jgi:hypothetical protein
LAGGIPDESVLVGTRLQRMEKMGSGEAICSRVASEDVCIGCVDHEAARAPRGQQLRPAERADARSLRRPLLQQRATNRGPLGERRDVSGAGCAGVARRVSVQQVRHPSGEHHSDHGHEHPTERPLCPSSSHA